MANGSAMRALTSPVRRKRKDNDVRTFQDAKVMAKALREEVATRDLEISHSTALEIVARQFGLANWNILAAKIEAEKNDGGRGEAVAIRSAIPIFRIFSVEKPSSSTGTFSASPSIGNIASETIFRSMRRSLAAA